MNTLRLKMSTFFLCEYQLFEQDDTIELLWDHLVRTIRVKRSKPKSDLCRNLRVFSFLKCM